jgi:HAD superfamily hydrolase (TIGR01509 family)
MRFRYFIWDFDGTIYDMYPLVVRAMRELMGNYDIIIQADAVYSYLDQPLQDALLAVGERYQLDPEAFPQEFLNYYRQLDPEGQPLIDGVEHVLKRIQDNGGNNFMFTHRRRNTLDAILVRHGIQGLFAEVANTDNGLARKPEPAGFRYFLDKYQLAGDDVLAIGDRNLDIQAAKAAGTKTCLYRTAYGGNIAADYVVDSYAELEIFLFGG